MKKVARKVREWLRDKDKDKTIDGLDRMASILFYEIITVAVIAYTFFIRISNSFGLGFPIVAIGAIAIYIIVPNIYVRLVKRFIKSIVWGYDDIQDLKFLSDCVDHMCRCVIKDWLKNDITDRQKQLEALQNAKHETKEDISLDITQKKENWDEIGVKDEKNSRKSKRMA